ncbi:TolC family protein [Gemmatirosa kalamazoonensis]|uniref:TolC family protein n=1 Tax=Gemmatirosa kalamazoonensis TaxID=861299 RepID=UPI00046D4106|nr:TolC family protein [Gemmatirosa kalamazoonensis]
MLTVTLDEAVQLALRVSPDLARDTGAVRTAAAAERTARAAFLPTLSLESSILRSTTPSPLSQPGALGGVADRTSAAGLAANLDLFTGGRRGAERRRAAAIRDASDAGLVARRFEVTLEAERAVFDALRAADQLRVGKARVARAEQGLAYAKHRHDAGVATRSDELRARLELSQARQALAQTDGALRTARWALGRVVGADGPVDAKAVDSLAPHPLALDDTAIVALVADRAPLVQSAEAADRAATATVRSARARYAPTVQLGGAYRVVGQPSAPTVGPRDPVWALRLGMSYPLFDGFQREETVTRARVESDVAGSALRDTRRAARLEAERSLEALHVAQERIALAEEGVQVATEDLRVVTVRYQNGAASILDLITSQTNLSGAESSLVDARFDYAVARAELSALAGRPL